MLRTLTALRASLLVPILACMVIYTAEVDSTFVPARCMCPEASKVIHHAIDFEVFKQGAHCNRDEIVMKLKTNEQQCLSTEDKQGKRLLQCWDRINKSGGDKKKCLKIRKKQVKNRRQKRPTS